MDIQSRESINKIYTPESIKVFLVRGVGADQLSPAYSGDD